MSQSTPNPEETANPATDTPDEGKKRRARGRRAPAYRIESMNAPQDEWLLTYSDMVTLLLTMFATLLLTASFEEPKGDKTGPQRIIEELRQLRVISPYVDGDNPEISGTRDFAPDLPAGAGTALAVVKDDDLSRIRARETALRETRTRLASAGLEPFIKANIEGDGIRLNIPNSILFDTGAADLQGRGPAVIHALGPILDTGTFVISVEGHTDDIPIHTERFPSNWELSAQRAAAVVRALSDAGVNARRLQAVGYADTRPLADNTTEDGRRENRRVTIFLRTG